METGCRQQKFSVFLTHILFVDNKTEKKLDVNFTNNVQYLKNVFLNIKPCQHILSVTPNNDFKKSII